MPALTRRHVLALLLAAPAATRAFAQDTSAGWLDLFDGKTLNGWKASEHEGTFSVVKGESDAGQIQVHGQRSISSTPVPRTTPTSRTSSSAPT